MVQFRCTEGMVLSSGAQSGNIVCTNMKPGRWNVWQRRRADDSCIPEAIIGILGPLMPFWIYDQFQMKIIDVRSVLMKWTILLCNQVNAFNVFADITK